MAAKIEVFEQEQDGKFTAVLCEYRDGCWKAVMESRHEKSLYSFIDLKRNAIMANRWREWEPEPLGTILTRDWDVSKGWNPKR